jgi:hypothetical protein
MKYNVSPTFDNSLLSKSTEIDIENNEYDYIESTYTYLVNYKPLITLCY